MLTVSLAHTGSWQFLCNQEQALVGTWPVVIYHCGVCYWFHGNVSKWRRSPSLPLADMGVKNDRLVPAQHGASNNDEGALMPAVASSSMARYIISTSRLLPRKNGWHCSKWRTLCSLSECTSCATLFEYSSFIISWHCKLVLFKSSPLSLHEKQQILCCHRYRYPGMTRFSVFQERMLTRPHQFTFTPLR